MTTGLFKHHIEEIRAKKHWWGRIEDIVGYDWNTMMYMIDTHPSKLYDWNREKNRLGCNEFHRRPSAPQIAKRNSSRDDSSFLLTLHPRSLSIQRVHPKLQTLHLLDLGKTLVHTLDIKTVWMCSCSKQSVTVRLQSVIPRNQATQTRLVF